MSENKPRWEIKYEKYLSEEPVKEKIESLEKQKKLEMDNLKSEIQKLQQEKVTGNFKTKEEYEKAVEEHNKLLAEKEKELEDKKNQKDNPELEGYKNFEKNKNKIENILQYRKTLEEKLEKFINNRNLLEQKKAEQEKNQAILDEQENRIDELLKEINSNPNGSDIEEKREDREITINVVKNLKEQSNKIQGEISNLEQIDTKLGAKQSMYERRISKCNMLAANLLKGKNLKDIELKLEEGEFKDPTRKLSQNIEEAKNYKEQEEKTKPAENLEEIGDLISNGEIIEDVLNNKFENNAIVEVEEFDEKHPKLAKVKNFFKKVFNGIKDVFKVDDKDVEDYEKLEETQEKIVKDDDIFVENISDEEIEEILNSATKRAKDNKFKTEEDRLNREEDELLKTIAEKGQKNTFKDKLKVAQKAAADKYAKEYGGRYEQQDGATAKKSEPEGR